MRDLNKKWKIAFVFMALTVFIVQSCNESDQNVVPELADELSKPAQNSWISDPLEVPDPCLDVCLVAGQHMNVGNVETSIDEEGNLYVSYNIYEPDIYLLEVHLEIFSSIEELKDSKKISNGGAIPGKFDYKMSWSAEEMVTSHTVKIPAEDVPEDNCFYIASHAALSNGETAWGGLCDETEKGVTLDVAKQFPGKNWSVYFQFCKDLCEPSMIDFTYAWEDLQNEGNDGDYNDLVIQSDLMPRSGQLDINFLAVARGAKYDHAFKFKIPIDGITGIFGAYDVDEVTEPGYYLVTVFPSTRAVLPSFEDTNHTNTRPEDTDCLPNAEILVSLTIDGSFSLNTEAPFEPFITVNPNSSKRYNLFIWEINKMESDGVWSVLVDGELKQYPNGILIPDDWKWPYERQIITEPYPDFVSIGDGYPLSNWASNLANENLVWTCTE